MHTSHQHRRTKGEAYGLRGMFLYYLLRAHAGFGENGELLGVPRLTEYLTINSDLNLPRASFADCVQQIYSDLEKAEELLPWEYNDVNEVPADFQSITLREMPGTSPASPFFLLNARRYLFLPFPGHIWQCLHNSVPFLQMQVRPDKADYLLSTLRSLSGVLLFPVSIWQLALSHFCPDVVLIPVHIYGNN